MVLKEIYFARRPGFVEDGGANQASYLLEYQKIWYRTKFAELVPNFLAQYQIS